MDENKKSVLRSKIVQYTKRAEELKSILHLNKETKANGEPVKQSTSSDSEQQNSYDEVDSKTDVKQVEKVPALRKVVTNSSNLKHLCKILI